MKGFRRRLFNALGVLSILLFIGLAALWVRSYYSYDQIQISRCVAGKDHDTSYVWSSLSVHGGWKIQLQTDEYRKGNYRISPRYESGSARLYPLYPFFGTWDSTRGKSGLEAAGFEFADSYDGNPPEIVHGIIAPLWFFCLLLLIFPVLRMVYALTARRRNTPD